MKFINAILIWLFQENDERKSSVQYKQAEISAREQFDLIQQNDFIN